MMKIKTAKNSPYPIEVVKDQTYYWCSCGLSENQPFCDRSHQSTELTPLEFVASESKTMFISVAASNQPMRRYVMERTPHCEGR